MDRSSRPGWVRRAAARLSPGLLALALLAFLLPFASVSCATPRGYGSAGGGVTATYRGITLVVGGAPELSAPEKAPAPSGPTAEDYVSPQIFAVAAFGLTIAALVAAGASLAAARRRDLWPAGLAGAAALFTALAELDFDRTWTTRITERLQQVQPAALGQADPTRFVAPGIGFWAILVLLTLAAALNAALALTGRRAHPGTAATAEPLPAPA